MVLILGITSTSFALSGKLDISKVNNGTVAVSVGNAMVEVKADGSWDFTPESGIRKRSKTTISTPKLAWTVFGREARLDNGNPKDYRVTAYAMNGSVIASMVPFEGNKVTIPHSGYAYLKLIDVSTDKILALRQSADSVSFDSTKKVIYYVIVSDSGRVDTLREIKITSWSDILPTSYVVQRNVDVTIPAKYDRNIVKVGYYNVKVNPSNYYSIELGRYSKCKYSGFVYSAYDSASYAGNGYLYSALAVINNSNDSVIAFSRDLDTVTAKVGNFSFDSTQFVNGIVSVRQDSLTVPWYAFNVKNGTSITAYHSVVKTLDSIVKDTAHTIDSSFVGKAWEVFHLDSTHLTVRLYKIDTNNIRARFIKIVDGDSVKYELDSVYVVITSKDSVSSKISFTFPYNPPSPGFVIQGELVENMVLVPGTNIVKFKATSEWVSPQLPVGGTSVIGYTVNIFGGRTTLMNLVMVYKTTKKYYK